MILLLALTACRDKTRATGTTGIDSGDTQNTGTDSGILPDEGCLDAVSPPLSGDVCVTAAPCTWSGEQSYEFFAYALDSGGDLDGDGYDEIVAGSLSWDGESLSDNGRAVIFSGGQLSSDDTVLGEITGANHGDYLGSAVAFIPDATGDGLAELLIGANGVDDGELGEVGAALLISADLTPIATLLGERAYARAGSSLSGADLDGDGLAELLIAGELKENVDDNESYAIGRVYVVSGRTDASWPSALADADASLSGEDDDDGAGVGIAGADLDGDGYPDLIVGAPYAGYTGRVYVYPGGAGFSGDLSLADAPIQISGGASYDAFGWAVTGGDLTGDGAAELVVGAPLDNVTWGDEGSVTLYGGGADFFETTPAALTTIAGEKDDFQLGTGLDATGDVSGDGINDLLMGGVSAYSGLATKSGRSYLLHGRADGWSEITNAAQSDALLFGAATKDYVGRANAAGDVNGDGTADVVVGSGYANLQGYYDVGQLYLFFGGS
ncbi:MAG: FG-GAP repeat protein [Myxococcota bacterium]|nr:FG-GAP repeat protein [Myxococcota bacterium]